MLFRGIREVEDQWTHHRRGCQWGISEEDGRRMPKEFPVRRCVEVRARKIGLLRHSRFSSVPTLSLHDTSTSGKLRTFSRDIYRRPPVASSRPVLISTASAAPAMNWDRAFGHIEQTFPPASYRPLGERLVTVTGWGSGCRGRGNAAPDEEQTLRIVSRCYRRSMCWASSGFSD